MFFVGAIINEDAAEELGGAAGDSLLVLAGRRAQQFTVKAIVDFDGAGTEGAALLLPLRQAQLLLGRPGEIEHVLVSNRGGAESGATLSDEVMSQLAPTLEMRVRPGTFVAGQMAGVEGYVESAALGLLAGVFAAAAVQGRSTPLPCTASGGDRASPTTAAIARRSPGARISPPLERACRGSLQASTTRGRCVRPPRAEGNIHE